MPLLITITETLTCPDCGCARLQPFASSRRQSQCLACGCSFHAEPATTFNSFDALLAANNTLPEVEFGSILDPVYSNRGWCF